MKLIKIMCKECKKKMTAYANKLPITLDINTIKDNVDKHIPNCKHH